MKPTFDAFNDPSFMAFMVVIVCVVIAVVAIAIWFDQWWVDKDKE